MVTQDNLQKENNMSMTPEQAREWFEKNPQAMIESSQGRYSVFKTEEFYQAIKTRLIEETTACEIKPENRVK